MVDYIWQVREGIFRLISKSKHLYGYQPSFLSSWTVTSQQSRIFNIPPSGFLIRQLERPSTKRRKARGKMN